MSLPEWKEKQVEIPCKTDRESWSCKNMKSSYEGYDGERYRCAVCSRSVYLDYEDMK